MKNIYVLLYQFLPVAILLSYLLYPDVFTKVSHHPLGKLLVVLFIAIIAHRNFIHGCILCLIVVLYYHQTTASFQNFSPNPLRQQPAIFHQVAKITSILCLKKRQKKEVVCLKDIWLKISLQ